MRKIWFIPLSVVALFVSLAGPARANPAPVGTGTWIPHTTLTPIAHEGDGYTLYGFGGTVEVHGFLEGTCTEMPQSTAMTHTLADGRVDVFYNLVEDCIGSVGGRAGTWTDYGTNHAQLAPDGSLNRLTTNMVMRGTGGDLAGMHGRFTLGPGTYAVWVSNFQ